MPVRARLLVLVGLIALVASGCRVDARLDLVARDDGSGTISVTVDVDAEVVALVPGLAEDLQVADLLESGWTIEGPTQINSGGLRVVLRFEFESPAEANIALAQVNGPNGPLLAPTLKRTVEGRAVATTFDASLQFVGGIEAFSDAELSELIGTAPWSLTAGKYGVDPMQSVSFVVRAELPGEIRKTTGTEAEGGVVWTATLDGSAQTIVLGTVDSKVDGGVWNTVATIVGFVLGGWLVLMGLLIVIVMFARRRRGVSGRDPIRRRPTRRTTPDA